MKLLGIVGEFVAAIVLIVAVTLQINNKVDVSNMLVSIGAILFAIFTKIKLVGYEWDEMLSGQKKRRGR